VNPRFFLSLVSVALFTGADLLRGETGAPAACPTGLVDGPATCSTSGCHGGASETSRQYVIWSQRDVHSRSYATLTSARSARMAEALHVADPTQSQRCTACHAPVQTVAAAQLTPNAHVEDGVACVSCHGTTTDEWLRSHTRKDWTHQDRVAAGMRDLRNLYGRANACVACHQNIDPELVNVGRHPQLIFELDGQAASEPKHWRETAGWNGAQAWYVGQAVALRELSSALVHGRTNDALDAPRWAGLVWLLQRCSAVSALPSLASQAADPSPATYAAALDGGDHLAQKLADTPWSPEATRALLKQLASAQADFRDAKVGSTWQARRAERLVLALDRLVASLPAAERPRAGGAPLDRLFQLAQSVPDFAPGDFASALAEFEKAL